MNKGISKKIIESIKKDSQKLNLKKVLVTLSGGADSIATTYALLRAGLELTALHCNFQLRGQESDRDQTFVENFCKKYDIPLKVVQFNVYDHIKSNKGESIEMACRKLRYSWFEKVLKNSEADRIVTGHNADDNIETFFLNLMRGAGTRGLKGMASDNGIIWRPLLSFHRHEIVDFLNENNLEFIVDSSNLCNDFKRNFIRNEIIPLFKTQWSGWYKSLDKTLENLKNENAVVEASIKQHLPEPDRPLKAETILQFPAPLLLIKRFIDPVGPFTTTSGEIMAAIKADKPHIRKWNLRHGKVRLQNGKLFIEVCHSEGRS